MWDHTKNHAHQHAHSHGCPKLPSYKERVVRHNGGHSHGHHGHSHDHPRSQCSTKTMLGAFLSFLGLLALCGLTLGLYYGLSRNDSYNSPSGKSLSGTIRVLNLEFSPALLDKASLPFKQMENKFCHEIETWLRNTLGSQILELCFVNSFGQGSLIVDYTLVFSSLGSTVLWDTGIISTVKDQITCGLSDPAWNSNSFELLAERASIYFRDGAALVKQEACQPLEGCYKENGLYQCKCSKGYQLASNGLSCDDVNECLDQNGMCEGTCLNTPGSYMCACAAGHQLTQNMHGCKAIEDCLPVNPCVNADCVDRDDGYSCVCRPGYTGPLCEIELCDTESGWDYYQGSGHCYKYFMNADPVTQIDSEEICQEEGGHLVSINDDDEMSFVNAILDDKQHFNYLYGTDYNYIEDVLYVWIGLEIPDPLTFGDPTTYVWTDGSSGIYVNWLPATDPTEFTTEVCVTLDRSLWNPVTRRRDFMSLYGCDLGELQKYMCEKPSAGTVV